MEKPRTKTPFSYFTLLNQGHNPDYSGLPILNYANLGSTANDDWLATA